MIKLVPQPHYAGLSDAEKVRLFLSQVACFEEDVQPAAAATSPLRSGLPGAGGPRPTLPPDPLPASPSATPPEPTRDDALAPSVGPRRSEAGPEGAAAGEGALPPGWQAGWDPASGLAYYCNPTTGASQWTRPA